MIGNLFFYELKSLSLSSCFMTTFLTYFIFQILRPPSTATGPCDLLLRRHYVVDRYWTLRCGILVTRLITSSVFQVRPRFV